jgi:hypothetical protein
MKTENRDRRKQELHYGSGNFTAANSTHGCCDREDRPWPLKVFFNLSSGKLPAFETDASCPPSHVALLRLGLRRAAIAGNFTMRQPVSSNKIDRMKLIVFAPKRKERN